MSEDLTVDIIDKLRNTQLTYQEIADTLGITYKVVWKRATDNFTEEFLSQRKRLNYSKSKTGNKNPMSGKTKEQHHNYIGAVSDCKGYLLVVKPDWYTGRPESKHIFLHHAVFCEATGLTEVPQGFDIHHIDCNPLNNELNNLCLVSKSGHHKLHAQLNNVQRLSRKRVHSSEWKCPTSRKRMMI